MQAKRLTADVYKDGIINGNITYLSKAITLIESSLETDKIIASELIELLLPYTGQSFRIGITGAPGVGKSTFIESFGLHLIQQNRRVAVLAIDPSSVQTKGSILGDKTRMEKLSTHENAYIRPSASGGSLGGVTYKTYETILLCEAAGFDTILIETVGVGQSEIEVSQICDFFLLLMIAGAGDELQGIKRGIMEMADAIVITKADTGNIEKAKAARVEFARALHYMPPSISGWIPEALICSSYDNWGIDEVYELLLKYKTQTQQSGYFSQKRKEQNLVSFQRLLQEYLQKLFNQNEGIANLISSLKCKIEQGVISPYAAIQQLMNANNSK